MAMNPNTIIPIIAMAVFVGILLIGTMLYLYVYFFSRKPLHLSVVIVGFLGLLIIGSEMTVIILGLMGNGPLGMQFHRLQAITITLFLFALPFMFHNLLELNSRWKKINRAVYSGGFIISLIIIACAFVFPETFLSFTRSAITPPTPWNLGRAAPGIVYRIRDILILAVAFYSMALMVAELKMNRRHEYIHPLLIGLIIGTASGALDLLIAMKEIDHGLYSIRVFSIFNVGLTLFIILSMISIMKLFIDQSEALEKARRDEYLELLAGGIAHDFNNILTGILGNVSLAMEHLPGDDVNRGLLAEIEKASARARDLTQQLLTFSRGGILFKNIVSLPTLIEETVDFSLHGSNAQATYAIAPDLWNADVDINQISQLIQNLAINAKQAMPLSGSLYINAENFTVSKKTAYLAEGKYLKIVFRDTGSGIPEENLQSIFEPYFSTRKSGAGLGLAISLSIIKKHHGHIEVSSKINEGTTFTVYIPATEKPAGVAAEKQPAPRKFSGRVLLMDDEDLVLTVGSRILQHIGFQAVCVKKGEDAIGEYRRSMEAGTPYDLVIMDLTIKGGMGGKDAVRHIKEIFPEARVIVSTGYSQDLAISDYGKFGFDGAIIKPYTVEDFKRVIDTVLGGKND